MDAQSYDDGRVRLLVILAVLSASPALADEPPPPRFDPQGYVGLRLGLFILIFEASLDGGAALDPRNIVWLHAEVLSGADVQGDRTEYKWKGALAGVELRTPGRKARLVAGVDGGMVRISETNEEEPVGTRNKAMVTVHGGGELVLDDHIVLRLGIGSSPRGPHLRLGLAGQF